MSLDERLSMHANQTKLEVIDAHADIRRTYKNLLHLNHFRYNLSYCFLQRLELSPHASIFKWRGMIFCQTEWFFHQQMHGTTVWFKHARML